MAARIWKPSVSYGAADPFATQNSQPNSNSFNSNVRVSLQHQPLVS